MAEGRARPGRKSPRSPKASIKRKVTSAGGVVFRGCRRPRVLLIMPAKGRRRRWSLPKGRVEPGERNWQTARREVREETGAIVKVLDPIEWVRYYFVAHDEEGVEVNKRVHYFLMRYEGGELRPQLEEVRRVRWVPVEEAERLLAFENERRVFRAALERWRKRCRNTR
ncbi:NUDIX hydrolase [Oceanithermus sp.]